MIKTLHITAIIIAALAAGIITVPFMYGGEMDPEVKKFLEQPTVVERFEQQKHSSDRRQDSESPLVQHAGSFGRYLNPPKPQQPQRSQSTDTDSSPTKPDIRPDRVSAKFTLIGTSYLKANPEKSMALIDQPGKGLRWVRQSSNVGHLVVEQVNDGFVVVKDGQRSFELTPKRENTASSVKSRVLQPGEKPTLSKKPSRLQALLAGKEMPDMRQIETAGSQASLADIQRTQKASSGGQHTVITAEERRRNKTMEEFVKKMKQSGGGESSDSGKDREQLMEELIQELKGSRVNDAEASELDDMGRRLEDRRSPGRRRPHRESDQDRR